MIKHLKRLKIILQSNIFYVLLCLIVLVYSLVATKLIKYESKYNLDETHLEGKVIDFNIDGNKLDLIVNGKEKVKATYYIKEESEKVYLENNILVGSTIKLRGKFNEPVNNTIPSTFNYKRYLYNKGVYRIFNVDRYELDNKISIFYKFKNMVIRKINSNEDLSPYYKTFILGDKRELNFDDYTNFQTNGVSHLFAISGMHISLFSFLLFFILKKLKISDKKSFILVFAFLTFYAFLTGFPASIVRALVFMLFLNLNRLMTLKITNIKCLLLTIFSILIFKPFMLYDLGFQYSSITVLSLLICGDYIKGNYFLKTLKISLVAFIFSMPITLYNFYEINLLSPFINVLFVPFVSYIIYPLVLLNFLFSFLNPITQLVLNLLTYLNTFSASLDMFIINIPKISLVVVILLYIFLLGYVKTKRKAFVFIIFFLLLFYKVKPLLDSNAYIYYLDVGQGDSAVLILPHQKEVLMIDTGGELNFKYESWMDRIREYKKSTNTISFLKSLGIKNIDLLILSHGDYDHMGEAINLVENFKVEKVIFNCGEFNELEQDLIKVLNKKKILYYSCIKELNIDDNKLYFLNNEIYDNENDNSSVIYTELNNHKFLFMGDAGVEVEEYLIEKYNLKNIDVLKVGHHGSKTSSSKSFIDEINPKYSIISVGKNNRYGHPNDSVLENLEDSKIYRTDKDGSVMFKIKNNKLEIETCSP